MNGVQKEGLQTLCRNILRGVEDAEKLHYVRSGDARGANLRQIYRGVMRLSAVCNTLQLYTEEESLVAAVRGRNLSSPADRERVMERVMAAQRAIEHWMQS